MPLLTVGFVPAIAATPPMRALLVLVTLALGWESTAQTFSPTWGLPREIPLGIEALVFDPDRSVAWVLESGRTRVHTLDLVTGFTRDPRDLPHPVSHLAISPSGQWLALAMPREVSGGMSEADGVLVDTGSGEVRAVFPMALLPSSLVVTDHGWVVVADALAQRRPEYWSLAMVYDGLTGAERSVIGNNAQTGLALSIDQRSVYAGEWDMVRHFTLDPVSGMLAMEGLSHLISFPTAVMGGLFTLPDGEHLLSRGGWLHAGTDSAQLLQATHTIESVTADPMNRAFFTVGREALGTQTMLFQYHSETFELASSLELPLGVGHVHLAGDSLYLVGAGLERTVIYTLRNPAAGGATNPPPVAAFQWSPEAPTTITSVRFDARATEDDDRETLAYRWDWQNDGRFDTGWLSSPIQEYRYPIAGTYVVRLEVKDRFGATGNTEQSLNIDAAEDPGLPVDPHTPFALPFRAADMAWEPNAPFLWLADTNAPRMVRLDLRTGLADRQYLLDKWPQRLAISQDQSTLLASMWTSARPSRTGYVAEIHLPTAAKRREVPIDMGVNELVAGPGDLVIGGVARGEMLVYRLGQPRRLDSAGSFFTHLAPSSSPIHYYLFNLGGLSRWELNPMTGELSGQGSISNSGMLGDDLFVIPGGTHVLSGSGRWLASAPLLPVNQDLKLLQTLHTGRVVAVTVDQPRRALFLLGTTTISPPYRTNLFHYHLDSLLGLGSYSVTNGARSLGVDADFVYVVAVRTNGTLVQRVPNPAAGTASNHPPVARYGWDPVEATTIQSVVFDASDSTDEDDPGEALMYRWDWDGDGNYETEFETNSIRSHRFNLAGTHQVILEVRDPKGATGVTLQEVVVQSVEDPGEVPVEANTPWVLPFPPRSLVFDPVRPRLFAADAVGKRLVRMDLGTGLIDRVYRFEHHPDALGISADGRWLGATTLHRLVYTVPPSPWKGFLAHVDLERDVKLRESGLDYIPRSLSVASSGYAILGGHASSTAGSGVYVHRMATGELIQRSPPYDPTRSAVHVSGSSFHAVTFNSSRASGYRFDIRADGSVHFGSGFTSDYLSGWIKVLDANRLVSGAGGVFAISEDTLVDGQLLQTLNAHIHDIAPDLGHRAVFMVGATWTGQPFLRLAHASTLAIGREWTVPVGTGYVHATSDTVYWVSVNDTEAAVGQMPNPARGGETNQPPMARFEVTPVQWMAGREMHFDAGSSTDDGSSGNLRYRWDWDGDGNYDTPMSSETTIAKTFDVGGTRTVVLEVTDAYGETHTVEKTLNIAAVSSGRSWDVELAFGADVILFHSTRPVAYAQDRRARRLVAVDLETGFTLRETPLAYPASSMSIHAQGNQLVVALQKRISADTEGEGRILVLDSETLEIVREFDVPMDPSDMVVTDSGIVVATSGSGQWTAVRSFHVQTGNQLGSASVYYHGRMALHPSQRIFYVSTTAVNPSSFGRFDLDPATGVITAGATSALGAGDLFPAPNGTEIVSATGALISASENGVQDLQFLRQIVEAHFTDMFFDTSAGLTFGVGSYWRDSTVAHLFVLGSQHEVLSATPMPTSTRWVHGEAPYVYTVEVYEARALIRRWMHPHWNLELKARTEEGTEGQAVIEIRGWPGRDYVLWQSPDLQDWSPLLTNHLEQGTQIVRPSVRGAPAVYYRATTTSPSP